MVALVLKRLALLLWTTRDKSREAVKMPKFVLRKKSDDYDDVGGCVRWIAQEARLFVTCSVDQRLYVVDARNSPG